MKKRLTKQIKNLSLDYILLLEMLSLILIGFLCLYSILEGRETVSQYTGFEKQIVWFCLGFILFVVILLIPFRLFFRAAYICYLISLVLLLVVLLASSGDIHRWIYFGSFQFQPSEFSKVATILALARYLSQKKEGHLDGKRFFIGLSLMMVPAFLILKQPDIGTASVFFAIFIFMVIWAGITWKIIFFLFAPFFALVSGFHIFSFVAFLIILWLVFFIKKIQWWKRFAMTGFSLFLGFLAPIVWSTFELYQQRRILIFVGIKTDPHGAAYQAIQSRVAIGSGSILGKGFMQGSQTQLRFLPEQHTDFIFSVFGEEFGFLGVMVALTLYLFLFYRLLHIARTARNDFAGLVVVGSVSVLAFQFFVNIGMTVGLMPITGLPLPFLSYGGSSLFMTFIIMGLAMNISSQRYKY